MYPDVQETMEHAVTGAATAFDIGEHLSLNVFITGYGETP